MHIPVQNEIDLPNLLEGNLPRLAHQDDILGERSTPGRWSFVVSQGQSVTRCIHPYAPAVNPATGKQRPFPHDAFEDSQEVRR